jgi:hypothetical protein
MSPVISCLVRQVCVMFEYDCLCSIARGINGLSSANLSCMVAVPAGVAVYVRELAAKVERTR